MTREPETFETLATLERIKKGEPLSILVGEGFAAVAMVLTEAGEAWLRAELIRRLTPPNPPAAAAAIKRQIA